MGGWGGGGFTIHQQLSTSVCTYLAAQWSRSSPCGQAGSRYVMNHIIIIFVIRLIYILLSGADYHRLVLLCMNHIIIITIFGANKC